MKSLRLLAVVGLAVALVAVPALAQGQPVQTFTFCISGQSDGNGWQYQIQGTHANGTLINTNVQTVPNGSVPAGAGANAFAQFFVQRLGPVFGAANANVNAGDNSCFDITARAITQFLIGVGAGAANPPACNVMTTPGGCAFNPTIRLKGLPTITEWGLIALAVLLAGGMGYMLYRRRPALRPAAP